MSERITKSFPVFDCDAHVNDPLEIWSEYVPQSQKQLVLDTYWRDDRNAFTNGTQWSFGGGGGLFQGSYNPICSAGPQMSKKILRRMQTMTPITEEQRDYLEHKGAYDPVARCREMDLMGIDQVLVIPTMMIMNFPFVENPDGAKAFCEAYNNWLTDWCAAVPGRLYGAVMLPLQSPAYAAAEIRRAAELGHPVGLVRPIDARGAYPNAVVPDDNPFAALFGGGGGPAEVFDEVFRTFEETGVCLGMHTFPAGPWPVGSRTAGPGTLVSPGEYLGRAGVDTQTLSFVYEMQTWLAQVLLGGVLDRYPKLKMLVFESNSQWLPYMLEHCDRLFRLYRNERRVEAKRLPSEAFSEQCAISFESDEVPTMRQWRQFEEIGIWASDAYHHDGADAWSAIREMRAVGVPEEVQAKLMGGNARRFYGIEPKTFVSEEPPPIERPAWFPGGPELDEWAELVAHPRRNADRLGLLGGDATAEVARTARRFARAGRGAY